jgi:hypothetical protein
MNPFSVGGAGKAINLLNVGSGHRVKNASLKGQCAKSYFYGADLTLEKSLQQAEQNYGALISKVSSDLPLKDEELLFLRSFCYLQYQRTDIAVKRTSIAQNDMIGLIFEHDEPRREHYNFSEAAAARQVIDIFRQTVSY